jgi:hypothetical protein
MLLASVITAGGAFAYLHHEDSERVKKGTRILVRRCEGEQIDPWTVVPVPAGATLGNPVHMSSETETILLPCPSRPEWARGVAQVPIRESNVTLLLIALVCGLYGFPAGLGTWGLYRLIRFAVKG